MDRNLTLKQKIFVEEYIKNRNATKAAIVAYKCQNINSAGVIGYQNLRKLNIRQSIDNILNIAGLSETAVASSLVEIINLGMGVKAKTRDSLAGIKLWFELKGYTISPDGKNWL